ncbi:MAG: hypothetical protein ACM37Z_22430, partial [Deltaproteobacteria bacterium]
DSFWSIDAATLHHSESVDLSLSCRFKSSVEILGPPHLQSLNPHPQGMRGSKVIYSHNAEYRKGKGGAKAPPFNAQLGLRCIHQRIIACLMAFCA